jgi:hypothetical protein
LEKSKNIPHASASSVSIDLISQIRLITAQFGSYSTFYVCNQSKRSYSKREDAIIYRTDIYGDFAAKLLSACGKSEFWKSENKRFRCWWADDDYVYVRIKSVETVKGDSPTPVINMTVSGGHHYLAESFGTYNSWILYNYGINFEAFGTADRAITFSKEQQAIDNLKLTGLGLSKGFISGEANYASSKASLQVLLRRLLSLRQFIENVWLYPKFFRPICEINEWTKSVPSEVTHRYRVKRTAQEIQEKNLVIIPKLQWSNRLDPSIDTEVIQAFNLLKSSFNFKISKDTLGSFASLDWYEEEKKSASEFKASKELSERLLGETLDKEYQQQGAAKAPEGAKPPGAAGSGAKPPSAGGGKGSGEAGAPSAPPGSKGENPSFGSPPSDGALSAPPIPASSTMG